MRLLFLSTWHPVPPDNGSKLRVYHLLRSLAERHTVSLCSFAFDTALPVRAAPLSDWGVQVHTVPLNPFELNREPPWRRFLSPTPVFARAVPRMSAVVSSVRSIHSFDVVIASTEAMASYALQAPELPVRVLEEHNSLSRWMHERFSNQRTPAARLRCWASWQKARRYERKLFGRFDLVTMVSELDRLATAELSAALKARIFTVANGVDCHSNRPGSYSRKPSSLVFNGALTYTANFEAMSFFTRDVFPRIRAVRPDVTLTVTGSTADVNYDRFGAGHGVLFTGYLDDIREVVGSATVCVAPLLSGGGTRLKILEAMALGTPVVATRKAAEGLDVVDGQHLLLADRPTDFAAATIRLLDDVALRRRLAQNARLLVEDTYDWSGIGARFRQLVESAAQRKGRGN